jgi:hypothetical protein
MNAQIARCLQTYSWNVSGFNQQVLWQHTYEMVLSLNLMWKKVTESLHCGGDSFHNLFSTSRTCLQSANWWRGDFKMNKDVCSRKRNNKRAAGEERQSWPIINMNINLFEMLGWKLVLAEIMWFAASQNSSGGKTERALTRRRIVKTLGLASPRFSLCANVLQGKGREDVFVTHWVNVYLVPTHWEKKPLIL